jgi:hypothetical protein
MYVIQYTTGGYFVNVLEKSVAKSYTSFRTLSEAAEFIHYLNGGESAYFTELAQKERREKLNTLDY